jgi:CheY-like chemotaxis protein
MVALKRALTALIVDDDRGVRTAVGAVLATAGHQTFQVGSAVEAIQVARIHRVDYSILDIHLRADSGLMILSDLRSLLQNLPAIFMSAAFTPQIRADAFALGARACLDKPLDIRALRCAVQEIIDHELL